MQLALRERADDPRDDAVGGVAPKGLHGVAIVHVVLSRGMERFAQGLWLSLP